MTTKNPYVTSTTSVNDAKAVNILWLINVKLSTQNPEIRDLMRSYKDLHSYTGEEIETMCRTIEGLL